MNDLFAGRVIFRGRESQRGAVRQLHHVLDRAFSKSGLANNDRAMQVFQGPADNLRAARAAFVYQNRHRKIRTILRHARGRIIALLRCDAALGGNDSRVRRQKLSANVDRAVQQTARIVAKIENQRMHSLLLQFVERFAQFVRGGLVELNQANVGNLERATELRIEQSHAFNALHFDLRAFQRVVLHFFGRRTNQRERDLLAGRAPKMIDDVLQIHFLGRDPVDL